MNNYRQLREKLSFDKIRDVIENLGYEFFDSDRPYDMNLVGVRNRIRDQSADAFDDVICALWRDELGRNKIYIVQATTDPGIQHMTDPVFKAAIKNGTAVMAEGQYRRLYTLGYHGSGNYRHRAFRQTGRVTIYRDGDLDNEIDLDPDTKTSGWFGLNLHAASLWRDIDKIGRYSAGCQVVRRKTQLDELLRICENQVVYGMGNEYTYTLLTEEQIDHNGPVS